MCIRFPFVEGGDLSFDRQLQEIQDLMHGVVEIHLVVLIKYYDFRKLKILLDTQCEVVPLYIPYRRDEHDDDDDDDDDDEKVNRECDIQLVIRLMCQRSRTLYTRGYAVAYLRECVEHFVTR